MITRTICQVNLGECYLPHPLNPPLLQRRGGNGFRRGALPLLDTRIKGEKWDNKGIERGEAPLTNSLPSPLMKGRGIKGEGLVNNLFR